MKIQRSLGILGLALFAVFIWLRNTSWMAGAEDTLPVLIALPLYVWLAHPWTWRADVGGKWRLPLAAGALLSLAGIASDLTLLLAIGWGLCLYAFLAAFARNFARRLLILPALGFPWIAQDAQTIGWWFRYTGAGAVEAIFSLIGFQVQREGTFLIVQGLPLSVDAPCAGLNVLQALLIAGFVVVYLEIPRGRGFWAATAGLLPLAWFINTLRILMLGGTALSFGSDFAMGWFHKWGGWVVLCAMFLLCQTLFRRLAALKPRTA